MQVFLRSEESYGIKLYAELFARGNALRDEVSLNLGMGENGELSVVNTLNWPRSEVIHVLTDEFPVSSSLVQKSSSGGAFVAINAQANGVKSVTEAATPTAQVNPPSRSNISPFLVALRILNVPKLPGHSPLFSSKKCVKWEC